MAGEEEEDRRFLRHSKDPTQHKNAPEIDAIKVKILMDISEDFVSFGLGCGIVEVVSSNSFSCWFGVSGMVVGVIGDMIEVRVMLVGSQNHPEPTVS